MNDLIDKLGECVEFGKINQASPYPPTMKGMPGADELTKEALEAGLSPQMILNDALIPAMNRVGNKFTEGKIFVPQMLLSAKAMNSAMKHLKPYFQNGEIRRKGVFIIGTVQGDLHDIGKNLTGMMVEGAGWEVIDLGTDVSAEKYIQALDEHPGADDDDEQHAADDCSHPRETSGNKGDRGRCAVECRVRPANWGRRIRA